MICFPEAEAEHMMLGKGEGGEEVLRGVMQIVGRAGGFVHNLKGMLHSPLDEEVEVKETDKKGKREGIPRGGGKSIPCLAGAKGASGKTETDLFPSSGDRTHHVWHGGRG